MEIVLKGKSKFLVLSTVAAVVSRTRASIVYHSTCNSCQDAVINPGPCPTGHCLQKPCPKAEKTCGPCKEKKVVFNKCNCPVVTCVKHCGPKKPCPKGEKEVGTKKDSCGCPVRKCIPPPTTGCTTTEVCVGKAVCTKWKCVGKCVAKKNGYWFF